MQNTHPTTGTKSSYAWLNLVAGGLLFIAPWVVGYSSETTVFVNHLVLGVIVAVVALLSLTLHHGWSWVNLAAGSYVIIASIAIAGSGASVATGVVLGGVIGRSGLGNALAGR